MKIQDVVSYVNDVRKNAYSTAAKIVMISDVDSRVRDEIMKTFTYNDIMRVQDQAAYDMPSGVTFDQIVKVFVDGSEIIKLDYRSFERVGYYLDTNGKIELYPVPTVSDTEAGVRIVSQDRLTRYTQANYDDDVDLLIPEPYSNLYAEWILAQMNYLDKQYEDYNNDVVVFNNNFKAFANWYKARNPLQPQKIRNTW